MIQNLKKKTTSVLWIIAPLCFLLLIAIFIWSLDHPSIDGYGHIMFPLFIASIVMSIITLFQKPKKSVAIVSWVVLGLCTLIYLGFGSFVVGLFLA